MSMRFDGEAEAQVKLRIKSMTNLEVCLEARGWCGEAGAGEGNRTLIGQKSRKACSRVAQRSPRTQQLLGIPAEISQCTIVHHLSYPLPLLNSALC